LNTKSSTEAELVAIDDAMGQILWTRHFLAAQGVSVPTIGRVMIHGNSGDRKEIKHRTLMIKLLFII